MLASYPITSYENCRIMLLLLPLTICLLALQAIANPQAIPFPGPDISSTTVTTDGNTRTLGNSVISAAFVADDGNLRLSTLTNHLAHESVVWKDANLFTVYLEDQTIASSAMRMSQPPAAIKLSGNPSAARLSERLDGQAITATFHSEAKGLNFHWTAILRDGSNYLRQELVITAARPVTIAKVEMFHVPLAGAKVEGYTDGAPVVAGNWFLGMEHPMAKTVVVVPDPPSGDSPVVVSSLPREMSLLPNEAWTVSTQIGVAPAGQLRRAFAYYLQRERAHPYRQYWHYNSWFDLGIGHNDDPDPTKRMNESQCADVIKAFEKELFQKRGVGLDGFVWDDGWDDWNSLWQFHEGFPNGFAKLAELAKPQGATMGAWLSPWGGYGESHKLRVKYGTPIGYETNAAGFSLAGPKYYAAFRATCLKMIQQDGLGYFKFDGIGGGTLATGAPAATSRDLDSLIRLIGDLRAAKPDVFINCTVGTWPSPYWVRFADSIWRQGEDSSFTGKGNARERWINYKDSVVYDRFASKSPLFPVNSLMYHGVYLSSTHNGAKMPTPTQDLPSFIHEVKMTVGYGSSLGELYITPKMMTSGAWDVLAQTIRLARDKRNVLADSHWVGGNPAANQIYGFAAWHPTEGGMLTLRNPDDQPQSIAVDVGQVFELPAGAPAKFLLKTPYGGQSVSEVSMETGKPKSITLAPFEVLVFIATAEPMPDAGK